MWYASTRICLCVRVISWKIVLHSNGNTSYMYVYIVHSAHTQISETEQKKTNKTIIEKHRKKYAQVFFL